MRITLNDGVVLEPLGEDILVLNPNLGVVERFDGHQAAILTQLSRGEVLNLDSSQGVEDLLDAGVVKQVGILSRRKAVSLGAAAAGATLASLSLPTAALAQSVESPEFGFVITAAGDGGEGTVVVALEADDVTGLTFELSVLGPSSGFQSETDRDPGVAFVILEFEDAYDGDPPVEVWIRWRRVADGVVSQPVKVTVGFA